MNEINPPKHILVIDDNPDDRQLVLRELDALFPEADVSQPSSPAEFDAALGAAVLDLVVTDLDIRWTRGDAVLAQVKAKYPACPVVMFTGTGDEMIAVELMKAGLDDYVVKSPRQLHRLRASLKLAVEIAESRSALSHREAELVAMVAHRDTVVRELHHRVKNNLQTMIGLLQIRGRQAGAETRDHLDEIAGRMYALGAVQSRIYEVGALDRIDFCDAVADIAETLARGYHHSSVTCSFEGRLHLEVDRAMPLALLCYEVILNALKHAWTEGDRGKLIIRIRTQMGSETSEIVIEDDGQGFAVDSAATGLGTRLIRSLAEESNVEVETLSHRGKGTVVTLRLV